MAIQSLQILRHNGYLSPGQPNPATSWQLKTLATDIQFFPLFLTFKLHLSSCTGWTNHRCTMTPLQIEECFPTGNSCFSVPIDACLYILHSSLVPRHLLESSIFLLESVKESGYVSKCNHTGEFSLETCFYALSSVSMQSKAIAMQ